LLDCRALRVTRSVRQRQISIRLLATLTRVGLAADAVHRDSQRRMRLAADRAERHRTRREALDDLGNRLDLFQRYRRAASLLRQLDVEQAADLLGAFVLAVNL